MRNRLTSLLFSLCIAAVFVPAIAAPTGMPLGLKEMWDAGDKAYSEKNYKQAAEWFDKASKYSDFAAQPKDRRAELYRSYGRALVGSEQFAKAIEPLNRSIDLIDQLEGDQRVKSGLNSEAYGLLSGAYAGQKMYREAAEYSLKELNAYKERFPEHKGNGLLEAKIGGWGVTAVPTRLVSKSWFRLPFSIGTAVTTLQNPNFYFFPLVGVLQACDSGSVSESLKNLVPVAFFGQNHCHNPIS